MSGIPLLLKLRLSIGLLRTRLTFVPGPPRLRYDIALLYLEQVGYELDGAVEAYLADENWEKDHPVESPSSGKAERKSNNWKYGINTSIPRKH